MPGGALGGSRTHRGSGVMLQFVCMLLGAVVLTGTALAADPAEQKSMPEADTHRGGQPPPTLQEVLAAALHRSPYQQVLEAQRTQAQALTAHGDRLLGDVPALALLYRTDQVGSDDGLREYDAAVELPLWRWGQRHAAQAVATHATQLLAGSEEAWRLTVAGEVRESIWEVALRQNNLVLARQEWQATEATERDVAKRVGLGELAQTDLMLARTDTLTRKGAYLRAEAEVLHAQQRYATLTGLERLPRKRGEQVSERATIVAEHPLLAQAQARVAEARARLDAIRQKATGNPQLLLGGKHERAAIGEDYNDSLQLGLRLPFGTHAYSGADIAAVQRDYAEAAAERDQLVRELGLALHEAEHNLETTQAALDIAVEQNQIAQEHLRLAKIAFSVGEFDLVGFLRVQNIAFAAQRSEQELRIMRQLAVARYNQAVGILP